MADSVSAELMGGAGFDWVIVDTQHGSVTNADLVRVMQALAIGNTSAVVRIPWTDAATIMRALDVGAAGVIVPMVNTPEEASLAAAALRYPPEGIRSMGPTRGGFVSTAAANEDVVLLVMIETVEASGTRRRDRRRARRRRPVRRSGRSGPEPRIATRLDRATPRCARGHGQDRGRGGQSRCVRGNGQFRR